MKFNKVKKQKIDMNEKNMVHVKCPYCKEEGKVKKSKTSNATACWSCGHIMVVLKKFVGMVKK